MGWDGKLRRKLTIADWTEWFSELLSKKNICKYLLDTFYGLSIILIPKK